LIGAALWEQQFSRDPAVVGRTIRINDVARTIVGVLPADADFGAPRFSGQPPTRAGSPTAAVEYGGCLGSAATGSATTPRETHPIFLVGRLASGATATQAQQELGAVAADLERTYPENDARGVHVESLTQVVFGPVRPALLVLLGAVALVLLVACANVANLLLARGAARRREITVRIALGASGPRLAQQFLVESTVLATVGALAGVALASAALDGLLALAPTNIPRVTSVGLDARVLLVTLVVTLLVALAFGLLPTLQARRQDLQASLQGEPGRGASTGREHRRFRSSLVVAELTLAVMLMAGAGLLIKSLWRLQQVDPGFRTAGVLKAEYQLPASRYPQDFSNWPNWREIARFSDELRRRVAVLPGVEAVTVAGNHPLDAGFTSSISVVGREAEAVDWPEPSIRRVDAGYFATLRVPLVAGRPFEESDGAASTPVVLINDAANRRFFSSGPPSATAFGCGAPSTIVASSETSGCTGWPRRRRPPSTSASRAPSSGGSLLVR
jgi:predicted permease